MAECDIYNYVPRLQKKRNFRAVIRDWMILAEEEELDICIQIREAEHE